MIYLGVFPPYTVQELIFSGISIHICKSLLACSRVTVGVHFQDSPLLLYRLFCRGCPQRGIQSGIDFTRCKSMGCPDSTGLITDCPKLAVTCICFNKSAHVQAELKELRVLGSLSIDESSPLHTQHMSALVFLLLRVYR